MSSPQKSTEEIQPMLDQLTSPDNSVKIQGADKLRQMGKQAENASQHLWDAFENANESQVRIRLFRAFQAVTSDKSVVVDKLKQQIQDPDSNKQMGAIDAFAEIGPDAQSVLPTLLERLRNNRDQTYQQTLSRAILAIEPDKTRLITAIEPILEEPVLYLFPFFDQLASSNPSESDKQELLRDLWRAVEANEDSESIVDLLASIYRLSRNQEDFADQLMTRPLIANWKKSQLFRIPYLVRGSEFAFKGWWERERERVLTLALVGLGDQFASYYTSMFLMFIHQSVGENDGSEC